MSSVVQSLRVQQLTKAQALKILVEGVSSQWQSLLVNPKLDKILDVLVQEESIIVPKFPQIFEFARLTQLKDISVVIIGQDPYPTKGHAHGLAFSCKMGIPESLKNIYKCLVKKKIIKAVPMHGDLTSWASQGVLMINRALTTHEGKPKAHQTLWNSYTEDLVRTISEKPIVFLLWGANAQQLKTVIGKKSFVLMWGHPSPLNTSQDFSECPHFTEANNILERLGRTPINWASIEVTETKEATEQEKDHKVIMMEIVDGKHKKDCIIFTDGACVGNGQVQARGSYAALIRFGGFDDQVIYERINRRATNIVAEGLAISAAFEHLQANPTKWQTAYINSDSEFWVKMFNSYMPNWEKKNMDFNEKENPDLTIPLWKTFKTLNKTHKVILRWVPAHDKLGWKNKPADTYEGFCYNHNDYVDKMATYALNAVEVQPGKKYVENVDFT